MLEEESERALPWKFGLHVRSFRSLSLRGPAGNHRIPGPGTTTHPRPTVAAAGAVGALRVSPRLLLRTPPKSPVGSLMWGLPFGNCLPVSDGPVNNSTGSPFFYLTPKDPTVADLKKNPMASLMLPEAEGEFCRKNIVDPEDPRCARLTLTGQMITVSPEEVEFAKQAMFSRHPVMRKWPRQYEWLFMKMRVEHVWLQTWYGGAAEISREEYFKAVPRKA
ncbi:protein CREG2 [Echinops telfairi]|uniref:Protein CREG2 n=1 Tax=Echinops telfairi TaxID=9371 RepID=A0ABM0ZQT5_ECHTE|nr:protein CREG2 [Echinops telfairi]